jgi:hypothetical protein
MGRISKTIEMDDLISVSSAPQSLQDQNCISVFFKEYSDSKKTNFKISEFKLVVTRSVSKMTLIEKLRLNIRKKFDFSHLKSANEISSKDYFKGLINKPQQVYQGIKIILLVYFFKNAMYFFNIIKKKIVKDKSLLSHEDNNGRRNELLSSLNNQGHNIIKFGKVDNDYTENEAIDLDMNKENWKKIEDIKFNKGINDSKLFHHEEIEHNADKNFNNESNIKIYEPKDSHDNLDHIAPNDINFQIESENYKEDFDNDFKKIIMQNQNENDDNKQKLNQLDMFYSNNSVDQAEKIKQNIDGNKDMISFVIFFY